MSALWSDLAPLILTSAVLPLQTIVTLLLVRSSLASASAWVAGMMVVRLLQGVLFGFVLAPSEEPSDAEAQYFVGGLLLVLALVLFVKALRTATGAEDEDAPPPQWITKASAMTPLVAFGYGAGLMTISVKFLVFTLGAIAVIAEAHGGMQRSILTFVLFVLLAHSIPLAVLGLAASASPRAAGILDGVSGWLKRNNRAITLVFSVIFGVWFLIKAADRLGI
jgi:hypothetical protein